MKKLVSIFSMLFIIMVLSLSTSVFASSPSVTLINRGEQIELVNPIIEKNDDYYISLDDLNSINLDYEQYEENIYGLGQLNGPLKYTFYLDSGILEYLQSFENAVFVENNIIYLSLDILIDIYSYDNATSLDYPNGILSFWINDYKTETHWVTYKIDNSIPISEDGMEVILYKGFKRFGGYGIGSAVPQPETFEHVDTTYIPTKTDVFNMGFDHSIKTSETHTFYDNARSYTVWYDIAVRQSYGGGIHGSSSSSSSSGGAAVGGSSAGGSSSGGGGGMMVNGNNTVGIKVDNDKYIGGKYDTLSTTKETITLTLDDCIEYLTISGTITVPEHLEDLGYKVIAEANNRSVLQENGAYRTSRDFVASQSGIISAGETTATYNLKVKPGASSYIVYVRFDNGEYIRQYVIYDDLAENKVHNFDNFVVSKEITGKIKLPEGVTSLTDAWNNVSNNVYAYITLQGATAPYYKVQEIDVFLDTTVGYADFVLRDDIGVENGYISFNIYGGFREIYQSGVYYDNTTTKYIAEDGKAIPTDTKDIVLNVVKGKVLKMNVNCVVNSNVMVSLNIVDNAETVPNADGLKLFVEAYEIDRLYDDDNYANTSVHIATVPEDSSYYLFKLKDADCIDNPAYLNKDNIWVFGLESPVILSDADLENGISTVHKGYDPPTPIEITYYGYSTNEGHDYGFVVNSLFDYEATIYVAYYGENNQLLHLETTPYTFEHNEDYELYFNFDSKYEPLAETIKMFVWTDNLRPLSNVKSMKPVEW